MIGDVGQSQKRCWPGLLVGGAGQSQKQATFLLGQAFRSERWARVRSEHCSSSVRSFGQRGGLESEAGVVPPWPGLPVGDRPSGLSLDIWAGLGVARHSQRRLLGRASAGKQVHEGPEFMNPTQLLLVVSVNVPTSFKNYWTLSKTSTFGPPL